MSRGPRLPAWWLMATPAPVEPKPTARRVGVCRIHSVQAGNPMGFRRKETP